MLRKSEIEKALDLEQEIGRRRRVGHFGIDAHQAIGPQIRLAGQKRNESRLLIDPDELQVAPFREIESPKGHIIYKF